MMYLNFWLAALRPSVAQAVWTTQRCVRLQLTIFANSVPELRILFQNCEFCFRILALSSRSVVRHPCVLKRDISIYDNNERQGKIGLLSFWSVKRWVSQFCGEAEKFLFKPKRMSLTLFQGLYIWSSDRLCDIFVINSQFQVQVIRDTSTVS